MRGPAYAFSLRGRAGVAGTSAHNAVNLENAGFHCRRCRRLAGSTGLDANTIAATRRSGTGHVVQLCLVADWTTTASVVFACASYSAGWICLCADRPPGCGLVQRV